MPLKLKSEFLDNKKWGTYLGKYAAAKFNEVAAAKDYACHAVAARCRLCPARFGSDRYFVRLFPGLAGGANEPGGCAPK